MLSFLFVLTFSYSPGSCPWHLHIETSGYNKRPAMRGKWSSGQWRRWRQTQPKCGSHISASSGFRWWCTSSRWCSFPAGLLSPSLWAQESLWPQCLPHLWREGRGRGSREGVGVEGNHSEMSRWGTMHTNDDTAFENFMLGWEHLTGMKTYFFLQLPGRLLKETSVEFMIFGTGKVTGSSF